MHAVVKGLVDTEKRATAWRPTGQTKLFDKGKGS